MPRCTVGRLSSAQARCRTAAHGRPGEAHRWRPRVSLQSAPQRPCLQASRTFLAMPAAGAWSAPRPRHAVRQSWPSRPGMRAAVALMNGSTASGTALACAPSGCRAAGPQSCARGPAPAALPRSPTHAPRRSPRWPTLSRPRALTASQHPAGGREARRVAERARLASNARVSGVSRALLFACCRGQQPCVVMQQPRLRQRGTPPTLGCQEPCAAHTAPLELSLCSRPNLEGVSHGLQPSVTCGLCLPRRRFHRPLQLGGACEQAGHCLQPGAAQHAAA